MPMIGSLKKKNFIGDLRRRLTDPKTLSQNYSEEEFISRGTVKRVLTLDWVKETLREEGPHNDTVSSSRPQFEDSILDQTSVLLAVLLLADLEQHYITLVGVGVKDEHLFDEQSFGLFCKQANLSAHHLDSLIKSRDRFGVVFYQGRRPTISRSSILPYVQRTKITNGSFGVIFKVEPAPGHFEGHAGPERHLAFPADQEQRYVAEKQIRPSDNREGTPDEWIYLCREAITQEKRQHPNIVPLLASYFRESVDSSATVKTLHLIFPWADKDLAAWMAVAPTQAEEELIREDLHYQIYALVSGLSYLHRAIGGQFSSHHDIKPGNILVFGRVFKLADFGNAHLRESVEGSETERDPLGTYDYQPPEYRGSSDSKAITRHGRAFDSWSIGCVIIDLAILIVHGWSEGRVAEFRKARLENAEKRCLKLWESRGLKGDSSFHNNPNVVDEWVKVTKYHGGRRVTDILAVAEGLMAEDPKSRLYTWEAELDLYEICNPGANRLERLEDSALRVQFPSRLILNGTQTPLHRAAQKGDSDRVKDLLQHGWPLFVQDADGQTAADVIEEKTSLLVKECLESYKRYFGRDRPIDVADHDQIQFLNAVRQGAIPLTREFLALGTDATVIDENFHSALYYAITDNNNDMVQFLLEHADEQQLRRKDLQTDLNPLQLAASRGHTDILVKLIGKCESNYQRVTGLVYAPEIEIREANGKTALSLAVEGDHLAAVKVLMDHHAQVFTRCKDGSTPIHAVASMEYTEKEEDLLRQLLSVDAATQCLEQRDVNGNTPIAIALSHQNHGCFRLLREKGTSIHTVNNDGDNLLHIIARTRQHAFLRQIVGDFKASEHQAVNKSRLTAHMLAARCGYEDVEALLQDHYSASMDHLSSAHSVELGWPEPNFYTLGCSEPWLVWQGRKHYWQHLTYDSMLVYETIFRRCRRVKNTVQCMNPASPSISSLIYTVLISWTNIVKDFVKQFPLSWPDRSILRRTWKRLLPHPQRVDVNKTSFGKAFVFAVLYMLHLELYHKSEIPRGNNGREGEVTDRRLAILTKFDFWIKCQCSTSCRKEWNFVSGHGIYRPPDGQSPPCKAVRALREPQQTFTERVWDKVRRRNDERILDIVYNSWKEST
ncbi:MAG: hypothetical protein Q9222_003455 [Ikaeria aurantiellina]